MTVLFLCLFAVSLIYCLFIHFVCMKKGDVLRASFVFKAASAAGLALGVISFIIYYVRLSVIDSAVAEPAEDAFYFFAAPALLFCAIILLLTLTVHFTRQKTESAIPYVTHLAAVFLLLWTLICSSWSAYDGFRLDIYIELTGISLALILQLPVALRLTCFAKKFDDKVFMKTRKYGDPKKLARAEEKKKIKDAKARIKSRGQKGK